MLILLVTLTSLLIIVICGTACFTTTASADTTPLKTYTEPNGFFTLQYPAEYKQPVTKFDQPAATFTTTNQPWSVVMTITVRPSNENTPEEFKDVISLLPSEVQGLFMYARHVLSTRIQGIILIAALVGNHQQQVKQTFHKVVECWSNHRLLKNMLAQYPKITVESIEPNNHHHQIILQNRTQKSQKVGLILTRLLVSS